ncbi:sugar ABC transporter ATP-binding protein [Actinoplanes sp. TBRC 11911]|uniref:ATP-binding cassette domain-containing protein n=1 Tax=Actinoplanes sp. TBRC 11911 TaxID=2729386 RepID=UPI00145E6AE0|nr:ATP-binding cassette domain-containing protein [Actinoplanes sp. TBRC 11911]NMO53935.1 sugar ABC transporter ATP-binding protein [Actinoplanes sp. TBRC 11911]
MTPTLELRDVTKRYGHVAAPTDVDFTVTAGEVVALVGDNGAGKSTLVKAIAGSHRIDGGEILIDGGPVVIGSPTEASALGIETVYQDLALCDNLDVTANLYLGRERRRSRSLLLDQEGMQAHAAAVIADLAAHLPVLDKPVSALSGGQRQAIAVSRAALWGSRIVLLDEPTAALGVAQTVMVYDLIHRLRDRGLAVVVISHNMADVFAVADRITVLRLGRNAGEFRPGRDSTDDVVAAITGSRELDAAVRKENPR